ncbi:DsbA family protein [Candidatus Falkowbacteria bacterium]|nr:DsbA family protein [Candidatus Falkowbacteria bacterium]
MPDNKDFFDMSSKQGIVMGFLAGISLVAVIGFFIVLSGGQIPSLGSNSGTVAGTNTGSQNPTPTPTPTPAPDAGGSFANVPEVTSADHIRGNANAKITMIEYSDFQCPFCQRHAPTLSQLLDQYGDDIRLVYRHFPLTSIHPQAQKSAEASECAAEQGKFWEYHDILFANQSALDNASLKSYAGQLRLNQSQFDNCLDSGKYASEVNQQAQDAVSSGITGTPGTWVNDELVKGAYPVETFQQLIDSML